MGLKAPDGTGIKGGKTAYHAQRMLAALSFVGAGLADDFAVALAVHHARLAARAALNEEADWFTIFEGIVDDWAIDGPAVTQLGFHFDPERPAFQPHSATSRAAAGAVRESAPSLRLQLLALLRAEGPMTDEEMQRELRMNPSTQRPRRVELVERGLVRDTGATRKTSAGRAAVLWGAVGS